MIYKLGIRKKLAIFISLAVFLVLAIGLIFELLIGINLLRKDVDNNFNLLADTLAQQVSVRVTDMAEYLKLIIEDPEARKAITRSNMRYQNMSPDDVSRSIEYIDSQWKAERTDGPLLGEYLDNSACIGLKKACFIDKELAEIFITDRRGALVASSGKTSDFYQADEEWWMTAYAGGKGVDYIGKIELDESSGSMSMPFAFPVRDDSRNVIGIAKASVDVANFLSFLRRIRIGNTGRVSMINDKGEIIIREGVPPLTRKIMCDNCLKKILPKDSISIIADICDIEPTKKFRVFKAIHNPLMMSMGVRFTIVVSQDIKEALSPIYRAIIRIVIFTILLSIFTVPFSYLFGSIFTRSIEKLHKAADMIAAGKMDCNIDINTKDEIGGLARSLNIMTVSIKEREDRLLQAKLYTDGIIASMADALIVVDLEGKIKSASASTYELLGYSKNELSGRPMKDIFMQEDEKGSLDKYLEKTYAEGAIYNAGLTLVSKDGRRIPINLSGSVMYEAGSASGVVMIARDMRPIMAVVGDLEKSKVSLEERNRYLTRMQKAMLHIMGDLKVAKDDLNVSYDRLKEAQDKLIQSEKEAALGRFATGIAHEVKNPLAMILAGAEFLEAKLAAVDENIKSNITMVKKSAMRANDILESILIYVRPTLLKIERADLCEIADEVTQLFRMQSAAIKADIAYECDPKKIYVNVDKIQIHQVLFNVVKNAIEASSEYGRVTIKTATENDSGVISIIDRGSGMSKETLSNVFEPFFTTKRPGRGTGLGLVMAKTIVDRHKGKIEIESVEGKGSTVKIILPLA